ncbi:MAG: bifunctional (p)ppGpp synthetase/guanosine-3',5'-bis(diphosphate) 3'-pyrophosphohydrolase [Candidatus Aminicenantes bacterium]|nr:bifunctional (p)ppGpp synthetase/guanosine-3',5'-bis(diphosphate) 3'-pyrophosphohydrolase [Candidatus Aminicenantes bacterium]
MIRFDDILEKASSYISEKELLVLQKAYVFAGKAHKGQVRRSGEPYLSHPLEVADYLADMKLDKTTLVAALLHDVLEDTDATAADIRENFGKAVADLVEGVTKISRVQEVSPEVRRAETIRKIILAMTDDIRVIFIKLADRIHNLKTLRHLDEERQRQIARETLDIYAPIANRLGMGRIRAELEDLSFRYVAPEEFAKIAASVEPGRRTAEADLKAMKKTLEELVRENGIPAEVFSRIKRPYSVWSKMKRRDIAFDQVFDFLALRVITDSVKNCYALLGIIHQRWPHLPQRFRDFIAMPKPNLYQALHTTLITEGRKMFEIQIRTREMHDLAENGIAAHWLYKDDSPPGPMKEDRRLHWLREMAALFEEQKNPREFLRSLKTNLIPEEVYVFTPKGKVIDLPPGATALDFAFKIHSEIGLHASGARVNGSASPLKTVLKTGDIVEILTSDERTPTRGLLASAATAGARQQLKRWLNLKSRTTSVALGRKLWEREIRKYILPAEFRREEDLARQLAATLGPRAASMEEFYRQAGLGKIVVNPELIEAVFPAGRVTPRRPGLLGKAAARFAPGPGPGVRIKDIDGQMIKLAKCCSPVKGEPVVGYITAGKGLSIHSLRCPLVTKEILDGQRLVEVSWDPAFSGTFKARLLVKSEDSPGVLAKVATAVAGLEGNISKAEAAMLAEGKAKIRLDIRIRDIRHLEDITQRISALKEVLSVERV